MNIKNVLVIAVTLLSVTTMVNANTSSEAEYSRASHSGFSLGFQSSSKVTRTTNQEVKAIAKKDKVINKSEGLVLGFNGSTDTQVEEKNEIAKAITYDEKVEQVNKVADSFNIGFNI